MKIVSELSLSMCIISVVSMILSCLLPDGNGFKQVFNLLCGILLSTVIFSNLLLLVNSKFDYKQFINSELSVDYIEEYIVEKNTNAYLTDVAEQTQTVFDKYKVKCNKIIADTHKNKLCFYINSIDAPVEKLTNDLKNITNVNCLVMVGDYDE